MSNPLCRIKKDAGQYYEYNAYFFTAGVRTGWIG